MESEILELSMKAVAGEQLTNEEKQRLVKRNAKYELVRFLYIEKRKAEAKDGDPELVNFQFSPGDDFENAPTVDVVNELVKWDQKVRDGSIPVKKLDIE